MAVLARIIAAVLVAACAAADADADNTIPQLSSISVEYNVTCSTKWMIVTLNVNSSTALVYLERLKTYPECQPERSGESYVFRLPLDNIYACGTTRVLNKISGVRIYYHRVLVEEPGAEVRVVLATCSVPPPHPRARRDTLPENFVEPEQVNITEYIVGSAPVPYLNVAVRQGGKMLDASRNVQPGTPLEMIVYLDRNSAETYGLMTSFLKVTDSTPHQEEVIIMNGCSIDPYIFGNFAAGAGGDALTANFRAFKFPDASYVLFVGTVSVCLQQCRGVPCGNGQLGFGRRRRRDLPTDLPPDPNKVYEVEMTTFLKVQYEEEHFALKKGALEGDFGSQNKSSPNISQSPANEVAALRDSSSASSWHQFCPCNTLLASALLILLQVFWKKDIE